MEKQKKAKYTLTKISFAEQSILRESSTKRFSLPLRMPASIAAPIGMTSSGGIEFRSSTAGKRSLISCCSLGIREDPPQRTT